MRLCASACPKPRRFLFGPCLLAHAQRLPKSGVPSAVSQAFDAGQHRPCIGLTSPIQQGQKHTAPSDQGLALKAIQAFVCTIYLSAGM
jgi:hypothetical protein